MVRIQLWPDNDVVQEKITIRAGKRQVNALVIKPKDYVGGAACVLWMHGGGLATGMKEMAYMTRAIDLVKKFGVVVVSPGYKLSWQEPYPAAIKDCYATLLYIKKHAKDLGIRDDQIMVGGESAGGGLTAALCMLARDKKSVNIAYQMPLYPMLDNFDTGSSRDNHNKVWNTRKNHMAWKFYLGRNVKKAVPPYAAPARQTDYTNLPPCYTFVCTDEPFYDETLAFVKKLKEAGVEAEVDIIEGMYHSFDLYEPDSPITRETVEKFLQRFEYALEHYHAPQN
ncbi:Acetyl esterase/lipase [Butyrivibrio sp. ob235]|uniref:alpha/beta hydrolase n=1 Tax=Butyrivibrio sp. ob235 TaxID=1761780 RepID=UPI0008AE2513|nr:alpha/beta hydrolase [Butyrivibrio sp. ob235]SEL93692.1 Acetyl esterase/lipase [Butyrivibrio sp. ob235]